MVIALIAIDSKLTRTLCGDTHTGLHLIMSHPDLLYGVTLWRPLLRFLGGGIIAIINSAIRPMKTLHGITVAHHIQFSGVSCVSVVQRKKWSALKAVLHSVARLWGRHAK